jgi:dTDP-4-dehydrorhamnose 3,5-epimerase
MSQVPATGSVFEPAPLRGVILFRPAVFRDARGVFVKTFHGPDFDAAGIAFEAREEFHSISTAGVIRGMHFQLPPKATEKRVSCLSGRVLDVLVDLRRGEPTFGRAWSVELSAGSPAVLHIPAGVAHGFLSLEDGSLVHYSCSVPHSAAHDHGIRWDSFGFRWGRADPILSVRDRAFPTLADFESPF